MNETEIELLLTEEILKTTFILPDGLKEQLAERESKSAGREKAVLKSIIENIKIASDNEIPVCQDTGLFEIWLRAGVSFGSFDFSGIVERAVITAHEKGLIRNSMDEIKPVLHMETCSGEKLEFIISSRGFGSENYSTLHMLKPEEGFDKISDIVCEDISKAAGKVCFPAMIGVGIGGTASKAVELSSKALTEIDFRMTEQEQSLFNKLNDMHIGAGSFGGSLTALGLKVLTFPKHIAGLALSVHVGCWCNRVRRVVIEKD